MVWWVYTSCNVLILLRCFERIYRLHLYGDWRGSEIEYTMYKHKVQQHENIRRGNTKPLQTNCAWSSAALHRPFLFWLYPTVRGAWGLFEGSIPRLILSISVSLTIWRTVANRKTQYKSISNVERNLLVTINWIVISTGGTALWLTVRACKLLVKGINRKWEAVPIGGNYSLEEFYR